MNPPERSEPRGAMETQGQKCADSPGRRGGRSYRPCVVLFTRPFPLSCPTVQKSRREPGTQSSQPRGTEGHQIDCCPIRDTHAVRWREAGLERPFSAVFTLLCSPQTDHDAKRLGAGDQQRDVNREAPSPQAIAAWPNCLSDDSMFSLHRTCNRRCDGADHARSQRTTGMYHGESKTQVGGVVVTLRTV
ncbi:hypothetical protein SKAU_G00429210 [Synaphobranchus kaupii]|uniref:Uncharacterized protein n=1 Tax=Synaphobranchus kaupii TaxID=118154 RepID=A0A9Q1E4I0_SYNKA|nr:hypothetical protein SKAU_G00429210 [Synaphobranchus kaupii]